MTQKSNYKFQENILKISYCPEIKIALSEWIDVHEETLPELTGLCICQKRIKHCKYMFNLNTKYTIRVGKDCREKFNKHQNSGRINKTLQRKLLLPLIRKGFITGYGEILDILKYAMEIETRLMDSLRLHVIRTTNLDVLQELYDDITELINDYKVEYLREIRDEIDRKITDAKHKIAEYEQQEKTRILELEKQTKIRETQMRERQNQQRILEQQEEERKTRERQQMVERENTENNQIEQIASLPLKPVEPKCNCGLSITSICHCENQKFEICKQNQQLYCKNTRCQKWKCRCELANMCKLYS
jgi:hypothetical protein